MCTCATSRQTRLRRGAPRPGHPGGACTHCKHALPAQGGPSPGVGGMPRAGGAAWGVPSSARPPHGAPRALWDSSGRGRRGAGTAPGAPAGVPDASQHGGMIGLERRPARGFGPVCSPRAERTARTGRPRCRLACTAKEPRRGEAGAQRKVDEARRGEAGAPHQLSPIEEAARSRRS